MSLTADKISKAIGVASRTVPRSVVLCTHYPDGAEAQSFEAIRLRSALRGDLAIEGRAPRDSYEMIVDWAKLVASGKVTAETPMFEDLLDVRFGNEPASRVVVRDARWDLTRSMLRLSVEEQFEYDENAEGGS